MLECDFARQAFWIGFDFFESHGLTVSQRSSTEAYLMVADG